MLLWTQTYFFLIGGRNGGIFGGQKKQGLLNLYLTRWYGAQFVLQQSDVTTVILYQTKITGKGKTSLTIWIEQLKKGKKHGEELAFVQPLPRRLGLLGPRRVPRGLDRWPGAGVLQGVGGGRANLVPGAAGANKNVTKTWFGTKQKFFWHFLKYCVSVGGYLVEVQTEDEQVILGFLDATFYYCRVFL